MQKTKIIKILFHDVFLIRTKMVKSNLTFRPEKYELNFRLKKGFPFDSELKLLNFANGSKIIFWNEYENAESYNPACRREGFLFSFSVFCTFGEYDLFIKGFFFSPEARAGGTEGRFKKNCLPDTSFDVVPAPRPGKT